MTDNAKCFGTTEFSKNNGMCVRCKYYNKCELVEPKVKRPRVIIKRIVK